MSSAHCQKRPAFKKVAPEEVGKPDTADLHSTHNERLLNAQLVNSIRLRRLTPFGSKGKTGKRPKRDREADILKWAA